MVRKQNTKRKGTEFSPSNIHCVDLFCGAGGLTKGLMAAGVRVTAGVDLDEACRYPYEANNDGAKFHSSDVSKLKASVLQSLFGEGTTRILAGCAPCQPFSSYAQRYETKGTPRWGLLDHFARLVKGVVPDVVTMENVPTVTKHKVFDDFLAELRRLGYQVSHSVVDSAAYGLPQRRRRLVLLASRLGPIDLREPNEEIQATVRDALEELPELSHGQSHPEDPLHAASKLSPLNLRRIKASVPGGSWRDWPEELVAACHKKDTGRSYPGVYGRMEWDKPSPTLTTQFFGFGNGRFGHPEQDRGLSLREGAILQGFPSDYRFVEDGKRVQFKALGRLIGNAVPVELGRVIGESILDHLKERFESEPVKRRPRCSKQKDKPAS